MRSLLAVTFAVVLSLAACGTDDSAEPESEEGTAADGEEATADDSSADDTDDGAAESTDDESADDGSAEDGGAEDGSADEGTADGEEASAAGGDGSSDTAAFCTAMAELDDALELEPPLLDPSRSPAEVEAIVVDVETKFDTVVDNSPPDLEPNWIIVRDAFREMTDLMRDAAFDPAAVDQAEVARVGANEEAFAAGERLPSEQEYCGS